MNVTLWYPPFEFIVKYDSIGIRWLLILYKCTCFYMLSCCKLCLCLNIFRLNTHFSRIFARLNCRSDIDSNIPNDYGFRGKKTEQKVWVCLFQPLFRIIDETANHTEMETQLNHTLHIIYDLFIHFILC